MTSYPGAPRLLKGALVALQPPLPVPRLVVFQYNPAQVTRTLTPRVAGGGGDRSEALRLGGAPEETLRMDVEVDATDQLERGDPVAGSVGIHPQLAALELLVYPASAVVTANAALALAGTLELVAPEAPLTLLVWGPNRTVAVRPTELTITEEEYDTRLNPIRAKVGLGLRVLSYSDLPVTSAGHHLFLAHQVAKEAMATLAGTGAGG